MAVKDPGELLRAAVETDMIRLCGGETVFTYEDEAAYMELRGSPDGIAISGFQSLYKDGFDVPLFYRYTLDLGSARTFVGKLRLGQSRKTSIEDIIFRRFRLERRWGDLGWYLWSHRIPFRRTYYHDWLYEP